MNPKTNKNIPDSIREASPFNFEISKNDINAPDNETNRPEVYVNRIIMDWMESITSELQRNKQPRKWESYHIHFGRKVVLDNEHFPTSLPIGYVLVCFFLSVYPKVYKLKLVIDIFNRWINSGSVRKHLFEQYRQGQFLIQPVDITVEEKPDGVQLSESLYNFAQGDIFSQDK